MSRIIRDQRREVVGEKLRRVWESNYAFIKPALSVVPPFQPILAQDSERPAVVVGAGPSLSKNIQDLKPEQYDIIACDKVVPKLIEIGVKPKYVVALNSEPTKVLDWIAPIRDDPEVTLVMPVVVWPPTWTDCHCKVIFFNNELATGLHKRITEETGFPSCVIGSNAGTFAYLTACYTNHSPIAYIGMDFSFTSREEVHSKQEPDNYNIIEFVKDGQTRWLTIGWLDMAEAFQEYCKVMGEWHGIKTYNCTEGGINYSQYVKEMTLKDFNMSLNQKKLRGFRTGAFYGGSINKQ